MRELVYPFLMNIYLKKNIMSSIIMHMVSYYYTQMNMLTDFLVFYLMVNTWKDYFRTSYRPGELL